jgi:hypothetical protein
MLLGQVSLSTEFKDQVNRSVKLTLRRLNLMLIIYKDLARWSRRPQHSYIRERNQWALCRKILLFVVRVTRNTSMLCEQNEHTAVPDFKWLIHVTFKIVFTIALRPESFREGVANTRPSLIWVVPVVQFNKHSMSADVKNYPCRDASSGDKNRWRVLVGTARNFRVP